GLFRSCQGEEFVRRGGGDNHDDCGAVAGLLFTWSGHDFESRRLLRRHRLRADPLDLIAVEFERFGFLRFPPDSDRIAVLRPNIVRSMSFSRLTCPSTLPLPRPSDSAATSAG